MNHEFWDYLQRLVDASHIVIDRPKGTKHPRFPTRQYPVDYGFLEGTTSIDSGGVDIWVGSSGKRNVVGMLCTVDLLKRDTELKIVIDCIETEVRSINKFVNTHQMKSIYVKKEE
jgi:inorganic pyrophosphatase